MWPRVSINIALLRSFRPPPSVFIPKEHLRSSSAELFPLKREVSGLKPVSISFEFPNSKLQSGSLSLKSGGFGLQSALAKLKFNSKGLKDPESGGKYP